MELLERKFNHVPLSLVSCSSKDSYMHTAVIGYQPGILRLTHC